MKIKLHEIEFGSADPEKSREFYHSILGLATNVDQPGLKVFNAGVSGLDFNMSTHFSPGKSMTSFLTDDLQTVMDRLSTEKIKFEGPHPSHLGMISIEFRDPDDNLIRINQATEDSPAWLKV